MAGNAFVIPGYNVDIIGAAQRAKERNLAQQQQAYQNLMNGFNAVGQFGKEYAARKFQEEEAEKARQFQAAEAAKARQHQAAMQEQQLAAQAAYNANVKAVEDAKLQAAQDAADKQQYVQLLQQDDSPARNLLLNQLIAKNPNIDKYETTVPYIFPNGGQKVTGSLAQDVANKRAEDADLAKRVALYRAGMPTSYANDIAVQQQIEDINKQGFGDKYTTDLVNYANSIKTGQAKAADAWQNNAINRGVANANEAADLKKALNEALSAKTPTSEQRKLLVANGYHWDKKLRKYVPNKKG